MAFLRSATLAVTALAIGAATASATLIDDFSGDLSAYTNYVILDTNGAPTNTAAWQINGGALEFNTTAQNGIDQNAFIRNGLSLGIGEEVLADITVGQAVNRDLGLYVGNTTPTPGVREDFVNVYVRLLPGGEYGAIYSRGFDGAVEFGLDDAGAVSFDSLFIARTGVNTYETGYYDGATRNVISTRTPASTNAGGAVGFYSDAREVGVIGSADNLRVIPEPTSAVLCGLLTLAGVVGRCRRR